MSVPIRKTSRDLLSEVERELNDLMREYDTLGKRQEEIKKRGLALENLKGALKKVLGQELDLQSTLPGIPIQKKGTPLGNFLRTALADGHPKTTEELAVIAEKTMPVPQGKSVRRMINFALYALQRHGAVTRNSEGRWQIKTRH
jgi:hypothetical protein